TELAPGFRRHLLDGVEDDLRAYRTIEPDDIGTERVERLREILGGQTVRRVTIGPDGHLRDDRDLRIDLTRSEDRLLDLVEIRESLEDEDVATAVLQGLQLLPERGACFIETGWSERLDANAERTDRAGDEQVVLSDLAS